MHVLKMRYAKLKSQNEKQQNVNMARVVIVLTTFCNFKSSKIGENSGQD